MPTRTIERDVTKLPAWAQKLLADKNREILHLIEERDAARALFNMESSETLAPRWQTQAAYLDPYDHMLPIGDGHVRYELEKDSKGHVDVRYQERGIERVPAVTIMGSRTICVLPVACNAISVRLGER